MALNINTCTELLRRYGELIGEIPEAEELYSNALWGLEKLGLSPEEVEKVRISALTDPTQQKLAKKLWIDNPAKPGESVLAHLARVEGEDVTLTLRIMAAFL